jgi:hypothetical protein
MAHTTPQTEIRIKSAQMVLSSIQTFLGTIFSFRLALVQLPETSRGESILL